MEKILIVEDSTMFAGAVKNQIEKDLELDCIVAASLAEAEEVLRKHRDELFLAVLDLHLPDAPNGEIVDRVMGTGIPVVVFTGQFDDEVREFVLSKNSEISWTPMPAFITLRTLYMEK